MNVNTATVFGLGKLGLPLACILAEKFQTIGVDTNHQRISDLRNGICPVQEPGLPDLLDEVTTVGCLTFTTDGFLATQLSDIVFILVPTPSREDTDTFDPGFVVDCCKTIGSALHAGQTVVVVSTVTPGDTEGIIRDTLAECAQLTPFELVYAPEFVALGDVLEGMRKPDVLLVGVDPATMIYPQALMDVYCALYSGMDVHVMTWREAEIAKLSLNCALSTKAVFADAVAKLACELDADPYEILDFVGADRRIGSKFLKPGPVPGGPCLPRDIRAMQAVMKQSGLDGWPLDLMGAIVRAKRDYIHSTGNTVAELLDELAGPAGARVTILGLSYKVGTPVVEESFGCELALDLVGRGIPVVVADDEADSWEAEGVERVGESELGKSLVGVLALPKEHYVELALTCFRAIVDPWGIVSPDRLSEGQILGQGRKR